ncbi:DUF6153 family protein [Streptomyces sp. ST2-7A]|uniref:DUF6153 family protein n=1 Tax=Streptomyces sp. ST2-7A TaxID=2907214 RepID=UPI001F32F899|nr:DUF6153 family protein [Streptomyces sp. ST2-7A]MCE7083018.1 hypothetical protein [Streptomyces sp. ST2-7A]
MSGRRSGTGRRGVALRVSRWTRTRRAIRVLPLLLGVLLLHGIGTAALAHAAVTAPGHHPAAHPDAGYAAGYADHAGYAAGYAEYVGHAGHARHAGHADHARHVEHVDHVGGGERPGHAGHDPRTGSAEPTGHADHHGQGAAHPFTAVPGTPGHPSAPDRAADVREPCGHAERTEVTCHAAGVALAPAPPFPTGSIPVPVLSAAPPAVRPCALLDRRAPPSLSELQLLRV